MNQTAKTTRRAAERHLANGAARAARLRAQALELDATFKALARKVLTDDDDASELPLRQLRVCAALLDGPLSMSELSRELAVSQSAITQLADRLQSAGMVTRAPDDGDRRVRSLQLTPRAKEILRLREDQRIARIVSVLRKLSEGACDDVATALSALRKACGED